jgi:iron complex outermembrane receptor protein
MVRAGGSALSALLVTTLLATGALPTAAQAQNAGAGATAADQPGGDEIVVTGQKRSENIQDVPKQVSVASQQQLATAGVTRITDLQTIFPSVTATDQSQNSKNPGIRGIAPIANSIGVQSQTGIIVDDIPQSTFSTLANELTDIDRVEVFPGPQSTLSGRNAAGGLINFVTRAPSSTPSYEFRVEQTTDTQTRASAFLTGPLSGNLNYSLSTVYNQWKGNLRNATLDNHRVGGFDTKGVRAKLQWRPAPGLTVTASGYYIHTDRTSSPFLAGFPIVGGSASDTFIFDASSPARTLPQIYPGLVIGKYNHTVFSPIDSVSKQIDRGGTLRVDYEVDRVGTLSSLTSYTYSTQPRRDQFIGLPRNSLVLPISDFSAVTDVQSKYFTQEVRLTSPNTGPLTYLVGAIYTDSRLFQPYYRPQLFAVNWDRNVSIGSAAAFGRATYAFTPSDWLTVGLRYQHDRLGYKWLFIDSKVRSRGNSGYGFVGGEVSYKHAFSDRINAYVTYSQSQTGKAYDVEDNATAAAGVLKPLQSERVHNWEVGLKTDLFDRRLIFNIDAFWADYSNYQIQTITTGDLNSPPVIRLLAIGKVRSRGVELTSALRVTRQFRLSFAGAYTDTFIRSFPNAACYTGQTAAQGCVNGTQGDLAGLPLPYSSKWKYTASADYELPLGDVDLKFGAFYRYQSKQHYDVLGNPNTNQGGFGTANIYIGPSAKDDRWSIQFFVNNVLNRHYYASLTQSTFYAGPSPVIGAGYDRQSFRYAGIRGGVKF